MMITLKTLPQATAQEVFDQVTQHLLRQGKAARSGTGACRYRVEAQGEILKCAAGCLIADNEYSILFENSNWTALVNAGKVPKQHAKLIRELQRVHDKDDQRHWPEYLQRVASRYNLQYNPPQQS